MEFKDKHAVITGGIISLTHAMAISLAGKARANSISPGWIETAAYHENAEMPNHSKQDHMIMVGN